MTLTDELIDDIEKRLLVTRDVPRGPISALARQAREANLLRAQLTEALAVLKKVEWGVGIKERGWCVCCGGDEVHDGHEPDCRLAAVLGDW